MHSWDYKLAYLFYHFDTSLSFLVFPICDLHFLCSVKVHILCSLFSTCLARPKLPDNFKDTTWGKLKEAICAIQNKTSISSSLEELYKAVENMCSHKMSSVLYNELEAECERHVTSRLSQFTGYPFCKN